MKKTIVTTIVALGLSTSSLIADNVINVKITNIKSAKGELHIGFYKREQNFPVHEAEHLKKVIKPEIGTMEIVVDDLPNGEYAIAILQDINSNNHLDTNFLGMPNEPFGFSKNFKPVLSAPEFDDCKFNLKDETKNFTIDLID